MSKIKIVPSMKDDIDEDCCWSASFNLAWDKFQNKYLTNNFESNNLTIKNLVDSANNKLIFNDNDFIFEAKEKSPLLKEKLKKSIEDNFESPTDFLNNINFENNNILLFGMNKFELDFSVSYENMDLSKFGNYKRNVKYFGFHQDYTKYNEQITPLFYADKHDFAVFLSSITNHSIILYRTN